MEEYSKYDDTLNGDITRKVLYKHMNKLLLLYQTSFLSQSHYLLCQVCLPTCNALLAFGEEKYDEVKSCKSDAEQYYVI